MDPAEIGARLKAIRTARGLSIDRLAAMAEVSPSLVKHIEAGRRAMTLRTAQRLGPLLGVGNLSAFYGASVELDLDARPSHPDVPEVRRALTSWNVEVEGRPESADYLRALVDTAWHTWHTSPQQRTDAGRLLPGLIAVARRSARLTTEPTARRQILAMEAQAYHLAQAYLAWHGERELVYLTVDRGVQAALASDDPLAIASSTWYAAALLRAVGRSEEALVELAAARALIERHMPSEPPNLQDPAAAEAIEWQAMLSDLWLNSSLTRARHGDQGAWADWDQASVAVDRLPAGYTGAWTRVGRVICNITGVMIAVELGDPDRARQIADTIDPETIPSTDRKARHLVELARGSALEGSPEGTLHLLTQAAAVSPETVAYTPAGRDLTEKLLRESGMTSRTATEELARRIGLEP